MVKRFLLSIVAVLLFASQAFAAWPDYIWSWDYLGASGGDRLAFSSSLTSTDSILTPPRAAAGTTATFSRNTSQYITDFEGVIRKVESGSPAVEGSRVVTNLLTYSEDLSNAAWAVDGGASKNGNTINLPSTGANLNHGQILTVPSGGKYSFSATLSGNGSVSLFIVRDGAAAYEETRQIVSLTSTPTRYHFTHTFINNHVGVILYVYKFSGDTATSVTVHNAQLENVTAQSNLPGEYVKTTSAAVSKCFATTNGNTVNGTTGVVTEGLGTPLPTSYPEWEAEKQYTINTRIQANGWWYYATNVAGPSGASPPTWPTGSVRGTAITISDGSMVWTLGGRLLLGYVSEPASTNKCTAYGLIPADTLGSELITVAADRDFSSDTGFWDKDGWAISGGTFNIDGSGSFWRSIDIVGKVLRISYTITTITSGSIKAMAGGNFGAERTAPGTYYDDIVCGASTAVGMTTIGATASIDNISIKEVTWAVGTKSFHNGSSFVQNITGLTLSGATVGLVKVADATTLVTSAGLLGINANGKAYEGDNSAGATPSVITFAGTAGNTNKHSGSIYIAKLSGSGTTTIEINGTTTTITGTQLRRFTVENVTPASGSQFIVNVGAGDKVQFLLPDYEELAYVTSVKPTAGGTATRSATSLSYPVAGNLTSPLWSAKVTATPAAASQDGKYFLGSYYDANNSVGLLMSGSNVVARKRLAGSNYDATKALTLAVGTTKRFGLRGSSSGWSVFVDSVKGVDSDNTSTPAAGTTLQIGMDGNSGNAFNGYFKDLMLYNKSLADGRF